VESRERGGRRRTSSAHGWLASLPIAVTNTGRCVGSIGVPPYSYCRTTLARGPAVIVSVTSFSRMSGPPWNETRSADSTAS